MQLDYKMSDMGSNSGLINSCSDENLEIELYNDLLAFSNLSPEEQVSVADGSRDLDAEAQPFNEADSEEEIIETAPTEAAPVETAPAEILPVEILPVAEIEESQIHLDDPLEMAPHQEMELPVEPITGPLVEFVKDEIVEEMPACVAPADYSHKDDSPKEAEPVDQIVTRMGGILLSLRSDTRRLAEDSPAMDTSTWFDDDTDLDLHDQSAVEKESTGDLSAPTETAIEALESGSTATGELVAGLVQDEQDIQLEPREIRCVDEVQGFICADCGSTIAFGEIFCHRCGAIVSV